MKLISPFHRKRELSQKFYSAQLSRKEARRLQEKEHHVVTESTFQGKTGLWEMRIGLEVHAQVQSDLKMFSGSYIKQASLPNSQVSPVDIALPGSLPVLNDACVAQAIKAALALKSNIKPVSRFDRKHYYYHDLPLGYQITQYFEPISVGGELNIELPNQPAKPIHITRIQMEIDSAKSIHDTPTYTMIDFNRSGIPLLEIITEPDISTSLEACEFIQKLTHLLKHIGVCVGEVGGESLRCDANISVKRVGDDTLGTRCEIKNLNSVKSMRDAIEHEFRRQVELIENGEKFEVQTRWFDPQKKTTSLARIKDQNLDYRFTPEPDLPPVLLNDDIIKSISLTLPELPDQTKERLQKEYNISSYFADIICNESNAPEYFEKAVSLFKSGERTQNSLLVAQWMVNELFYYVKESRIGVNEMGVTADKLVDIIGFLQQDEISGLSAKKVIAEIMNGNKLEVSQIIDKLDCRIQKINDEVLISDCQKIIDSHPAEVEKYKAGSDRIMRFFMGEMMKATKGKGDSKKIQNIFVELLKK